MRSRSRMQRMASTSYAWSPDGRRFAYTMQDDDPNSNANKTHLDAFQVARQRLSASRRNTARSIVWICDSDGSHAAPVDQRFVEYRRSSSPDGGGELSWSPDSKTLAIEHFPTPFVGDSLASYIEFVDAIAERGAVGSRGIITRRARSSRRTRRSSHTRETRAATTRKASTFTLPP